MISAAGLLVVGSCNEKEGPTLHSGSAITFFAGFGVWALADLASSAHYWHGGSRAVAVVCFSVFGGCKLGALFHWLKPLIHPRDERALDDAALAGADPQTVQTLAYAEWLAAAALIGYFVVSNVSTPDCKSTRIAFYERADAAIKK